MNTGRRWHWLGIGLLAIACAGLAAGCESGDEDETGDAAAATDAAQENGDGAADAGDTPAEVEDGNDAVNDADADDDEAPAESNAPVLVSPANGATLTFPRTPLGTDYNVSLKWSSVPGAVGYLLQVDGTRYAVTGTSKALGLDPGRHVWSVQARSRTGSYGPASERRSFTVDPSDPAPI